MQKIFMVLLAGLLLVALSVRAADSAYTSLEEKSCKMLKSSETEAEPEGDYFSMLCPGRDGYEIRVDGGDGRSWFVVLKNGVEVFNAMNDVFQNAGGHFPYVSGKVLEWRYPSPKNLSGLIVRVNAQDENDHEKNFSNLLVFRQANGKFCYLGKQATNEGARTVIDGGGSCF